MIRERQIILAKPETTYGVDSVPTASANAILAELADVQIIGRPLERNNVKPYFGKLATVNVGDALRLDFLTELKGSGAVGTAPEIGALFRGCGFTESITPVTKVDYDPNSNTDTSESLTIYFYLDGLLHKMLGCRGTFSLDVKAGEYGKVKWTFTGLYAKPTDQAIVTGTYNPTVPPRFLSAAFAIDAYAAIIATLSINCGNIIAKKTDANQATGIREYFIKGREVTGSIDPEAVFIATKDFYTMWEQSSRVTFTATLGQVAGNKCIITGPKVSLGDMKYGDREGILTLQQTLNFTPNAGNDEVKFSFP